MRIVRRLFEETRKAGVPDEKVYVDPLVMSVATDTNACLVTLATMRAVLAEFPKASFHLGRSVFFRSLGNALPIASRTILRCTPTFFATPAIVPIPNSYSRRICSNNSTFALQSNESPPFGFAQIRVPVRLARLGQIKPPNWARSHYRNHRPHHRRERPHALRLPPLPNPAGNAVGLALPQPVAGAPCPIRVAMAFHIHSFEAANAWYRVVGSVK